MIQNQNQNQFIATLMVHISETTSLIFFTSQCVCVPIWIIQLFTKPHLSFHPAIWHKCLFSHSQQSSQVLNGHRNINTLPLSLFVYLSHNICKNVFTFQNQKWHWGNILSQWRGFPAGAQYQNFIWASQDYFLSITLWWRWKVFLDFYLVNYSFNQTAKQH